MAGVLDTLNDNKQVALGQYSQLSGLAAQRDLNNKNLKAQAKAQRNHGLGQGLGTLAVSTAMGNPVGMVLGGVQLLGSLF